jgi:hypothetical protein
VPDRQGVGFSGATLDTETRCADYL